VWHKLLTVRSNVDHTHRRDLYSAARLEEMAFTSRRSYASAVLGVVILSVCPSVRPSHACFLTNPKNLLAIFCIPHERAILLVKCDFSYSCAAADKISTDSRARAVSLRQLSYLFDEVTDKNKSALFMAHGVDTAYCY